MATYKVLQDIEAEDKFIGPLTLKQFIFAGIGAVSLYLGFFLLTKHLGFMLAFLLPISVVAGFLAWPWSRDQPTEVWLLAKIRFMLKPRRRIWNQDGIQELVSITAPKKVEQDLTDNLTQTEVKSRLKALAETIDSRGWAIKNVNVNLGASPTYLVQDPTSDRLIDVASLPKEVSSVEVNAADDILDPTNNPVAHHLDEMIHVSTQEHRQHLMKKVDTLRKRSGKNEKSDKAPAAGSLPAPQDLWFMQNQPQAPGFTTFNSQTVPPGNVQQVGTAPLSPQEEQALLAQLHPDKSKPQAAYGHMKVIDPNGATTPPASDPAILGLANNNDLNIATIARQAQKDRQQPPDDEIVVPLR